MRGRLSPLSKEGFVFDRLNFPSEWPTPDFLADEGWRLFSESHPFRIFPSKNREKDGAPLFS